MIDADNLIGVARQLNAGLAGAPPTLEAVRRAVSTAYYVLFHAILAQAADRFVGPASTAAAYDIIYRAFDHRRVKDALEAVDRPTLAARYRKALGRTGVSQEIRDFASTFVPLQDLRHLADYSPATAIPPSDAAGLIDDAELALQAWRDATMEEKTDLLAVMLSGIR